MTTVGFRKGGHDLLVVGGGPAGLSAALFGARLGLSVLLVEKMIVGGHPAVMARIDDYPGITDIDGWDLTRTMERQAKEAGVTIAEDEEVETVVVDSGRFRARTGLGRTVQAKAVIIAAGGESELLGVPGEKRLARKGVHYCVQCAGSAYKKGRVAVCGNHNQALGAAAHLLTLADTVYFITVDLELTGDAVLRSPLSDSPKLTVLANTRIIDIRGEERVEQLVLQARESGETSILELDALFVYRGFTPCSSMVDAARDDQGFLQVDDDWATSVPGLFAAGHVVDPATRLVTAVADGCRAAQAASRYIATLAQQ